MHREQLFRSLIVLRSMSASVFAHARVVVDVHGHVHVGRLPFFRDMRHLAVTRGHTVGRRRKRGQRPRWRGCELLDHYEKWGVLA